MFFLIALCGLTIVAVAFPAGLAILYCGLDATGINSALGFIASAAALAFPVGAATAYYSLWRSQFTDRSGKRRFIVATVALFVTVWGIISERNIGMSLKESIISSGNMLTLAVIYAMAYWRDKWTQRLLVAVVALQLVLGMAITLKPDSPVGRFHTHRYLSAEEYVGERVEDSGSTYAENRRSAQFYSAIHMAFFGTIGLGIGMCLLVHSKSWAMRLASVSLIGVSAWVQYATVTRALWLASTMAALMLFVRGVFRRFGLTGAILMLAACIFSGLLVIGWAEENLNRSQESLVDRWANIMNDDSFEFRLGAISDAWKVIVNNPVLGTGSIVPYIADGSRPPHDNLVFSTLVNGLPAGIAVAVLNCWVMMGLFSWFQKSNQNDPDPLVGEKRDLERDVAMALAWAVLWLGRSNIYGGGKGLFVFWLCMGIACTGWTDAPVRQVARVRSRRQRKEERDWRKRPEKATT